MKIAFLGTGIMGAPMACHLQAGGNEVSVWNRTAAKAEQLSGKVSDVAASPSEAAKQAEAVVVMVSDDDACEESLFGSGAIAALPSKALVIVMSTISVALARDQALRCADYGCRYIDAPVSGGQKGAREASLAIMAGGSAEDFAAASRLFELLGNPVHVGPAGSGQLAKAVNQAIVANTVTAVAEGLLLAKAGGADLAKVREALLGGFADSTILRQHALRMIAGDFDPGGPSVHQLKDLRIVRQLAQDNKVSMPVTSVVEGLFADFVENKGGAALDHSAIYAYLAGESKIK